MPISLTSAIETEIAKKRLRYIELWKFDLGTWAGTSYVYYWATQDVPSSISFDSQDYEGRIVRDSSQSLPRPVGKDEKKISVKIAQVTRGNSTPLISNLYENNVYLEHARASVVRIFPDLAKAVQNVGDWSNPYWHGRVTAVKEFTRDHVTCELQFGYLDLSKRFGRVFQRSCHHVFADGDGCPYDIDNGRGLPQVVSSGTVTGGTSTTIVDTGADFVSDGISVNDWVVAENGASNLAVGQVTQVQTTTLSVDNWRFGGPPASGWDYIAGPAFASCGYHEYDCDLRGMYAVSDNRNPEKLNYARRRFFGGWTPPTKEGIPVRTRESFFKFAKYTSFVQANVGMLGEAIPVPVGRIKMRGVRPLAWFEAGRFLHFLYPVGEARVNRISGVRINGHPIDNQDTANSAVTDDSLVLFGFEGYADANDQDGVDRVPPDITQEQQKTGVGIRQSYHWNFRQALDQYESNPEEFNNSNGTGVSPMNISKVRGRIEAEDNPENLEAEFLVEGGTLMEKVSGGAWTAFPDMAEVAYNAFIRNRWGAGLSKEQMDAASWQAASDFCRQNVSKTQTEFADKTGTIDFGPLDGDSPSGGGSRNWVFIALTERPHRYIGGTLTVTVNGTPYSRTVIRVRPEKYLPDTDYDPELGGDGYGRQNPNGAVGDTGAYLFVDSDWDPTDVPSRGDAYTLSPESSNVPRYMANGVLNVQGKSFGETIEDIMRCMNGAWFQNLGKVYCAVRKQENLTEINQRMTITDKGSDRNVVIRGGRTTARLIPKPVETSYNAIIVEFQDRQRDYQLTSILIKNSEAQLQLKNRYGEQIRDKTEGKLYLALITDIDTAARLGTLIARSKGIRAGNRHNVEIELEMPAHIAMQMIPVSDVYPLDLDDFPSWVNYGRVEKIEENLDKLTSTVTFSLYVHADYDDSADDQRPDRLPGEIVDSAGNPVRFKLESLTEGSITNNEGVETQTVQYEVTLPS